VHLSHYSSNHAGDIGLSVGFGRHILTVGYYNITNFLKVRDGPWHMITPMDFIPLTSTGILVGSAVLHSVGNNNQNLHLVLLHSNIPWGTIQDDLYVDWCLTSWMVYQRFYCGFVLL
jgi:hypothetical protein